MNFFAELIQFVPIIILAFSFLVKGDVDLNRARFLFLISGAVAMAITIFLIVSKYLLNPILLGTNIWLVLGALAFYIPIPLLAEIIGRFQAVSLYFCVFIVAIILSFVSHTGFIGMLYPEVKVIKRLSIIMLVSVGLVLLWSYIFIDNIRLGGGLPFILLNIFRRILIHRNQKPHLNQIIQQK